MKTNKHLAFGLSGLLSISLLFSSCSTDELETLAPQNATAINQAKKMDSPTLFYALTNMNQLVKYSSNQTIQEMSAVIITGLQSGESLLGIDFRPATGQLYAVSNQSRLYVIDQMTGAAMAIGSQPFSPAIEGTEVGFDFNPTVDRIRLVTNTGQNLRLNPITGAVAAIDGDLNPGNPAVVAAAYTNSMAGATSTTLYDIDVNTDKLYIQSPPNSGGLVEVGSLNVQASGEGGFDISPDNSMALAVLFGRGGGDADQQEDSNGNKYRFYSIDLQTGKAKNLGKTDRAVIGIAIMPTGN
ncbi:DUF4394 domain-containing protein [Nibribacter koreensis]